MPGSPEKARANLYAPPPTAVEPTAEGLDRTLAILPSRAVALGIDLFFLLLPLPLLFALDPPEEAAWALMALPLAVQVLLLSVWGRTVGKRVLGLSIVDELGRPPGFVRVLVREGVRVGLLVPDGFGWLGVLVDHATGFVGSRTLHDRLAGTWVVAKGQGASRVRLAAAVRPTGSAAGAVGRAFAVMVPYLGVASLGAWLEGPPGLGDEPALSPERRAELEARRDEVPQVIEALRSAEARHFAATGEWVAFGSRDDALSQVSGEAVHAWEGSTALGWAPDGPVRGGYWVEVGATGPRISGVCDVDGNGSMALYEADAVRAAHPMVGSGVY